jgi:hypothetical protein
MAAGDVINGLVMAATNITFQPAAGVQCVITTAYPFTNGYCYLTDGVSFAWHTPQSAFQNMKMMIDNTRYFYMSASVSANSFTGMQIK